MEGLSALILKQTFSETMVWCGKGPFPAKKRKSDYIFLPEWKRLRCRVRREQFHWDPRKRESSTPLSSVFHPL